MFNSLINVYKTEWLDLVFADRNKNYGAYELRSKSSSIMTRALFVSGSLFILLCFSPLIYAKLFPKEIIVEAPPKVVDLTDVIHQMKPKTPEPEKKVEPAKADPVKVKTVALSQNIVVVNKVDLPDPPTIKEIQNAVISDKTQDGIEAPNLVIPDNKGNGNGTGIVKDGAENGDPNAVLTIGGVDEYPEFNGGAKAWSKYMERNLRYPYQAQEENVQGKVFVSFVVERDGSVTDVKVLRGLGFGCDEEAIKVIKKSPLWKPGKNKGVPVRVRYNMAINFQISN
ncbi:energy transducer TonB [Pedobacter sp. ISL-68]|uniref:energy transducer TonB n=1 Tax=unclassified Pedobacter TaxID=2628915 RepID=UPI001BEC0E25|nr:MULTISPECIES: energy transducer TonB [unclassified Pedobacter]MBT2560630.1 energy transducer TonB [Pedobacter sp. ISL-64]MBT2590009.1 energy transducer TonB [Pedobacter sp. ISL-68]